MAIDGINTSISTPDASARPPRDNSPRQPSAAEAQNIERAEKNAEAQRQRSEANSAATRDNDATPSLAQPGRSNNADSVLGTHIDTQA